MVRNLVLAVATLAVLVLVFVGYGLLVSTPAAERAEQRGVAELQKPEQPTTQPLQVGDLVSIPAGGKIMFRRYDDKTGRPRDMFLCRDWQPVPGSKSEILVSEPELALRLPGGMIATISAAEGQITVERLEESQMRPKLGWLAGDVRMVVDRETAVERSPAAERPEDLITITLPRLSFDLELGELKTDERVAVVAEDFELAGTGLHLVWNQSANRIETLTLAQGEQFVLYAAAGLFGLEAEAENPSPLWGEGRVRGETAGATTLPQPLPEREGSPQISATRPKRKPRPARPATGYDCMLTGGLVAEQYRGSERVGGLDADEVHLLFDVSGAGRFGKTTATRPTSRPSREDRDRLVVRWSGPLTLGPVPAGEPDEPHRRRFEAVGHPVVMTRGDGTVRCGKVAYHDDTRRVWLYPAESGAVEFGLGPSLSATAQSVFIDRAARIVKLIGDVALRSRRGGAQARVSSISSTYWAELHLAESAAGEPDAPDALVDVGNLRSATFVGDVQVDLGGQQLTTHQLDVTFKPDAAGRSFEESLDTALACGEVVLTGGKGRIEAGQLGLAFAMSPEQNLYPRQMDATGAVTIHRDRARITGERVSARLEPPPVGPADKQPAFVIRSLEIHEAADLLDPDNKLAARGDSIVAAFEGLNRLTTARVTGDADAPGLVHARPYTVRGQRIDIDRGAQTLHVDGPSRLTLRTQRSLQGQQRGEPVPVVVTSERRLHIDGRRNTVRLEGQVVAQTEAEQLQSETLTLLLEDVADTAAPETRPAWQEAWRQARRLFGSDEREPSAADLFAVEAADDRDRIRKEPVRLTADQALVLSETYEGDDPQPIVHASIAAPLLEVDIVSRQIVTTGLTDLLMMDRRGVQETDAARDALGLPSALLSRGASQSAMRCNGRMTYTLGPDGPGRRDTVVFEDEVVFVHRTGKEMVNIAEMLPQVADHPELLDTVQSRNAALECDRLECWFAADEPGGATRRGGALTRAALRLAALTARGRVYMRDQLATEIREIHADWLEFNREQSRVEVHGRPGVAARIYVQDKKTGRFDPHTGQHVVVNLRDGTIRSGRIEGEMRR
jgi:hypothetical protein